MAQFKNILVAVDFSEVSAGALKVALDLAGKLGAKVKVVHAVPLQVTGLPLEGGPVFMDENAHKEQMEMARVQLARFIEQHASGAAGLETEVLPGFPATEVNRAAEEAKADLIVMGTHGRTGLSHLLMGSVAESVLREARVPLLCVRGAKS